MPAIETKPTAKAAKPEPRDANHQVSRTVYINKSPVTIDYAYDLDPKDPEGSAERKEAAFAAALAKKYPTGLITSRMSQFHYELR